MNLTESKIANPTLGKRKRPPSLWSNWQIASLLIAIAVSFLAQGFIAPIRTLYARDEGASGVALGFMAAAFLFSGFVFLFPFGWLSDRVNRPNLIIAGLIGHSLITLGFMFTTSAEMFILLRFVEGITAAAVSSPARALLADLTPSGRNGEAFGLFSAVITFGMFAGPPMGTLMAEITGFQAVYLLSFLIFIPSILLVLFSYRGYSQRNASQMDTPVAIIPAELSGTEKLLTLPIVIGCLVKGAIGLGPGVAIAIWSLFAADLGFSLTAIGWTYTVYSIPIILVAPWAGRFSDRVGRLLMMFSASILLSFVWMSYGIITSFLIIMIIGVVEGSIDAVSRAATDGYLADHSPLHSRGKAQGLYNAVQQFGTLAGSLIGGLLYENTARGMPFVIIGLLQFGLMALAFLLYLLFRPNKKTEAARSPTPVVGSVDTLEV
ncbi:MFS transporter [Candidatus Chlorohelix sp.]|uniref:MFS transporter n=1 Tax=Candidatus Chlorohelix sp. TaxID=3139201 RepID=UPI0030403045